MLKEYNLSSNKSLRMYTLYNIQCICLHIVIKLIRAKKKQKTKEELTKNIIR